MTAGTFTCKVTNGKLPAKVTEAIRKALERVEGKMVDITIKRHVKLRSSPQNRFYWGVAVKEVTRMFREAGNDVDAEDVHEFLKEHVGKLSRVLVTPDGEVLKMPGSTKRLTTMEFMDYIERIRAWSAEMGLLLPLPNESPPEFNPLEGECQNDRP